MFFPSTLVIFLWVCLFPYQLIMLTADTLAQIVPWLFILDSVLWWTQILEVVDLISLFIKNSSFCLTFKILAYPWDHGNTLLINTNKNHLPFHFTLWCLIHMEVILVVVEVGIICHPSPAPPPSTWDWVLICYNHWTFIMFLIPSVFESSILPAFSICVHTKETQFS